MSNRLISELSTPFSRPTTRSLISATVAALCAFSGASVAAADPVAFEIRPGSAAEALAQFSKQSGLQMLFVEQVVEGHATPGLQGSYEPKVALERLLEKSGLTFRFVNERTVTVGVPTTGALNRGTSTMGYPSTIDGKRCRGSAADEGKTNSREAGCYGLRDGKLRLAQAEDQAKVDPTAGEGGKNKNGSSSDTSESSKLQEIVVTGTTIRGVYPSSSPVAIYTAEDIARSGATTLEQFVGKIPQNLGTFSQYAAGTLVDAGNPNAVTSVDLRGLGVGTTLTLVNGRRIASSNSGQSVDVSLIPASAISRVEVLTDGASAIYGSDAIGGVINFVLRDDYEGAETRASYGGVTDGGMHQFDFGQLFGTRWSGGHGLVSYNFHSATPLERSDRSYSAGAGEGTLTPDDTRHHVFATAEKRLSDAFRIEGDAGYTWRRVKNTFTRPYPGFDAYSTFNEYESKTRQGFANVGLLYDVSPDLAVSFDVGYSETDVDGERTSTYINQDPVPPSSLADFSTTGSTLDATAKVEGGLFSLPGGEVRFSLGGGVLQEKFRGITPTTEVQSAGNLGRRTMYGFGELFAPMVIPSMDLPFVRRLELSVASRYTDYQDISRPHVPEKFGSSIDPKVGVLWSPIDALSLRGTYGQSFRAPSLTELDRTAGAHYIIGLPVSGQPADVAGLAGYPAPELKPETAETYTLGFDFKPKSIPGFSVSGTFYSIDYTDRIEMAPTGGLNPFSDPALLPEVIYRAPSAAFIEEALRATPLFFGLNSTGIDLSDPSIAAPLLYNLPNFWIYDRRLRNLALSRQKGLDLSLSQQLPTRVGDINLAANVTHIFSYNQQATPTSQTYTATNIPGGPPDWRGRASASLSRNGFDGTLSVNFVGAYENPWVASTPRVDRWTTLDLSLAYDLGLASNSRDKALRLSLSVQNVLDKDPPYLDDGSGTALLAPIGFDPANANPLGRLIVVGVTKTW